MAWFNWSVLIYLWWYQTNFFPTNIYERFLSSHQQNHPDSLIGELCTIHKNINIDIILGPCHSTSEPRKIWPTSSLNDQIVWFVTKQRKSISPIGRNTISYFSALFRIVVIFCAGAEVMCAETVPVRMHTASQQRQGPEATLVWSQPEPGVKAEDWLLFVR